MIFLIIMFIFASFKNFNKQKNDRDTSEYRRKLEKRIEIGVFFSLIFWH